VYEAQGGGGAAGDDPIMMITAEAAAKKQEKLLAKEKNMATFGLQVSNNVIEWMIRRFFEILSY
jgi:hypothetical protein